MVALAKPVPGQDNNVWGTINNAALDALNAGKAEAGSDLWISNGNTRYNGWDGATQATRNTAWANFAADVAAGDYVGRVPAGDEVVLSTPIPWAASLSMVGGTPWSDEFSFASGSVQTRIKTSGAAVFSHAASTTLLHARMQDIQFVGDFAAAKWVAFTAGAGEFRDFKAERVSFKGFASIIDGTLPCTRVNMTVPHVNNGSGPQFVLKGSDNAFYFGYMAQDVFPNFGDQFILLDACEATILGAAQPEQWYITPDGPSVPVEITGNAQGNQIFVGGATINGLGSKGFDGSAATVSALPSASLATTRGKIYRISSNTDSRLGWLYKSRWNGSAWAWQVFDDAAARTWAGGATRFPSAFPTPATNALTGRVEGQFWDNTDKTGVGGFWRYGGQDDPTWYLHKNATGHHDGCDNPAVRMINGSGNVTIHEFGAELVGLHPSPGYEGVVYVAGWSDGVVKVKGINDYAIPTYRFLVVADGPDTVVELGTFIPPARKKATGGAIIRYSDGSLRVAKATDHAGVVNNTLVTDATLTQTLPADTTYRVTGVFYYTALDSADLKVRLNAPAGATGKFLVTGSRGTATATTAGANTMQVFAFGTDSDWAGNATGNEVGIRVEGTVTTTTKGDFTVQYAQNATTAGTPTVLKAGSYLQFTPTT